MRAFARRIAWRVAPGVMADRAAAWNRGVRERHGLVADARAHTREHGTTVAAGPFEGLRYPEGSEADVDALVLKLTGAYEADLHPVIAEAAAREPRIFVDIGTSDGYYAVGFARLTGVETHGFEPSRHARSLCAELARVNGVRLSLHGAATSRRLRALPLDGAFVISDCEGAEAAIFDDRAVAALRTALVVIEVHDWAVAGVTALLRDRFEESHEAELVRASSPEPLRNGPAEWLVLRPRASGPVVKSGPAA